jgi:hypothetical protein
MGHPARQPARRWSFLAGVAASASQTELNGSEVQQARVAPVHGSEVGVTMTDDDNVAAVFSANATAESAVQTLRKSGYDIGKLSIVLNDYRFKERIVGFYRRRDRIRDWRVYGVLWGGVLGLLLGIALSTISTTWFGLGMIAEPLTVGFGAALCIGGLGAISAGAYSMASPNDSVLKCNLLIGERSPAMSGVLSGAPVYRAGAGA